MVHDPRRDRFVKILAARGGRDMGRCALEAGYGRGVNLQSAKVEASRLIRMPEIQAALKAETSRLISTDALLARATLVELCQSGPAAVRYQAASKLLSLSGFDLPTKIEHEVNDNRTRGDLLARLAAIVTRYPDAFSLSGPSVIDAEFKAIEGPDAEDTHSTGSTEAPSTTFTEDMLEKEDWELLPDDSEGEDDE
jgi:hypothetical protein